MNITTKYKTNANGTGQILAKGGGKQRTVPYNQEKSPAWNHGNAAGVLGLVLGLPSDAADITMHMDHGDGSHTFKVML